MIVKIKEKAIKIVIKTIIIFTIALILLNSVITMPVFAGVKNIPSDYQEKIDEIKEVIDDEELKSQLDNDGELAEFLYIYQTSKGSIVSDKKNVYTDLAKQYVEKYKPFKEENKSDFDGEMKNTHGDFLNGFRYSETDEFLKYIEPITKDYNKYVKEHGLSDSNDEMRTKQEVKDIQSEENQRVIKLLQKTKDNGSYIVGPVFEAIFRLAVAIGDSVINVMQKMMMPGSPTALKQRYNDIRDILDARGDTDLYYIFFYEVRYEPELFGDSDRPYDTPWAYVASTDPVPFIYYTPLAIFSNKLPAFDVNFIDENSQLKNPYVANAEEQKQFLVKTEFVTEDTNFKGLKVNNREVKEAQAEVDNAVRDANGENTANPAKTIQNVVAKWFVALRNVTAVGLLIVLVYIGIRILLSATGEEQARYKTMLKDWVMSFVILFFLQFIMATLLIITRALSDIAVNQLNFLDTTTGGDSLFNDLRTQIVLFGKREDLVMMAGYTMLYIAAIWYTIIFTWKYIKRVIYMAFLTVISPLVALTYPIDKIRDGKSQAFDLWLKEYVYNLLLQPIDLLVYIVIFSAAMELIKVNPIYGVVAIGFVAQAEKIIKKMFGFQPRMDNGNSAFTSGAIFGSIMSGLQTGARGVTNTLKGEEDELGEIEDEKENAKIRMEDDGRIADTNALKNLDAFKNRATNNVYLNNVTGGGPGRRMIGTPNGTEENAITTTTFGTNPGKQKIKNKPLTLGQEIMNLPRVRGIGRVRARYFNKNTAMKAGKLAAMGLGAGVFGTIGIGAGLASDDYSNVFKMGAAGMTGGALLAEEATKQAGAIAKEGRDIRDAFQKGYYGDEYNDKILNPKLDRKWYKSEQTKRALITKYGDNWREKREEALELRKQGITNQEDIERAIKLKDKDGFSIEEAGNIIKFADQVTSRKDILSGGEENLYKQILGMVGDEKTAKKVLKGVKSTLNLGGELNIREQPKQREVTPDMVNDLITTEEHKQEAEKENPEEKQLDDVGKFYNNVFDFGDPNQKDKYEEYVQNMLNKDDIDGEKTEDSKATEDNENDEQDETEKFYNDIYDFGDYNEDDQNN